MRFKSFLAALVIGLSALCLVGCGSSDEGDGFVGSTLPAGNTTTGSATFNFVQAQFAVGATASTIRLEFFANTTQAGNPVSVWTGNFAPSISVPDLSVAIQSVRGTSFDTNGVPLVVFTQNITITAGVNTVIPTVATPTAVLLSQLVLTDSNSFPPNTNVPLTRIDLTPGGVAQVYLVGIYNNGSKVVLGSLGTYGNDPNDANSANIFTVGTLGQIKALAVGNTKLIVSFGGQTIEIPVSVTSANSINFATITANDITIAAGATSQLIANGTINGQLAGLDPARTQYALTGGAGISINATGMVTVAGGTAAGTTATVTVTYTNPNGTVLTDTATVTSS